MDEIHEFGDDTQDLDPGDCGNLACGPAGVAKRTCAGLKQDCIAQAMWESYLMALQSGRYYDILE